MNINDVKEWMTIADADFDSAKILNESVRKYREVICYLCAQAIEKYLKCYLAYNDIIPQKTHNLVLLNDKCAETDGSFGEIKIECGFINRYVNEIRYPYRLEVYEEDVIYVINSVERIRNLDALKNIREEINNKEKPNSTDNEAGE
jgi:HEPN domain-containing protein